MPIRTVLDTARDTKASRSRPKPAEKPFSYRLTDVPALVGISVSQLRAMIGRGEIHAVRRGRMILIPRPEVVRLAGGAE